MTYVREKWQSIVWEAVAALVNERIPGGGPPELRSELIAETPPHPEMGDLAFPMFPFSRVLKTSPQKIAEAVLNRMSGSSLPGEAQAEGPYINVRFAREQIFGDVLDAVAADGECYGRSKRFSGRRVMCEFSCPNTNKPLHLGHLRNDALGESVTRILKANGAEVLKVNLINDRGIHICKSMTAYQEFGDGRTPEKDGIKPDHFVGEFYVKYAEEEKTNPQFEARARELLRKWESGDPPTTKLWKRMNGWAVKGLEETYRRTGISFDRVYFESKTYLSGKDEVIKGLKGGIFYRKADGSVWVDLTGHDLDHKVLLRKDGTSVYITQDIGTAIHRYRDWPFDRLIYVVASEQNYHFQVLFKILEILELPWAGSLYHLAYGMVNLPEGKMKSREGTVVDADNLIEELVLLAKQEIHDKERDKEVEDIDATAEKIALGAITYFLLQYGATKDIIFNPAQSISFAGNTGPYLQYTGARISSILRKFGQKKTSRPSGDLHPELLTIGEEWELVKLLADYPDRVIQSGVELSPSILTSHVYSISKTFNKYYHENSVLHNEDANLVVSRIRLVKAVKRVLMNAFELLGIPFLEKM